MSEEHTSKPIKSGAYRDEDDKDNDDDEPLKESGGVQAHRDVPFYA